MLVLSRREGERIVVDAGTWQVEVQVLRAGNGRVRLGVVAPRNVAVHREEVWERIQQWREPTREDGSRASRQTLGGEAEQPTESA